MSVVVLALTLFATPANAKTILSQGTTDTYSWEIDDEGVVYIYPTGTTDEESETGDQTYVLYNYGSLQVVYVTEACSTDSISNANAMFESGTTAASTDGSLYEGTYGNVARANVASDSESTTAVEDVAAAHAPGWAYENGAYVYYEPDGTMRTNAWVSADGAWYYLGEDGAPVKNAWATSNGAYYYLGANGTPIHDAQYDYDGTVYTFGSDGICSVYTYATGSLAAVVDACYYTPSTGSGGCAAWVSNVFSNAGIGSWHGNACDFYWSYCTSSNLSDLKPGMIIAVSSCAGTSASRAYGHVGIYIGNGIVMQNLLGTVGTMSLDTWLSYFDGYSTPAWGWLGGVVLS